MAEPCCARDHDEDGNCDVHRPERSRPRRLRIRTRTTGTKLRPRGQDTVVEVVHEDGTATPVPGVSAMYFWVSGREHYCTALLVAHAEIDAEVTEGGNFAHALGEKDSQLAAAKARIAELEDSLETALGPGRA